VAIKREAPCAHLVRDREVSSLLQEQRRSQIDQSDMPTSELCLPTTTERERDPSEAREEEEGGGTVLKIERARSENPSLQVGGHLTDMERGLVTSISDEGSALL
jgi:hypothetical protein